MEAVQQSGSCLSSQLLMNPKLDSSERCDFVSKSRPKRCPIVGQEPVCSTATNILKNVLNAGQDMFC